MNELKYPLAGKVVNLSISESGELGRRGLSLAHLRDFLVESTRLLLSSGAQLSYGGDFRKEGYTDTLIDLVRNYKIPNGPKRERLISYQAWPLHLLLKVEDLANFRKTVEFVKIPAPSGASDPAAFVSPESPENGTLWARSLRDMRREFATEVFAGIAIGGQTKGLHRLSAEGETEASAGFKGFFPGVAQEIMELIKAEKPVYPIGAYGGATAAVIEALEGGSPEVLSWDYQSRFDLHAEMFEYHNAHLPEGEERVSYKEMCNFLNSVGVKGLRNGLTPEENRALFAAKDVAEAMRWIFTGMSRLLK